jgi:hypothetical protein
MRSGAGAMVAQTFGPGNAAPRPRMGRPRAPWGPNGRFEAIAPRRYAHRVGSALGGRDGTSIGASPGGQAVTALGGAPVSWAGASAAPLDAGRWATPGACRHRAKPAHEIRVWRKARSRRGDGTARRTASADVRRPGVPGRNSSRSQAVAADGNRWSCGGDCALGPDGGYRGRRGPRTDPASVPRAASRCNSSRPSAFNPPIPRSIAIASRRVRGCRNLPLSIHPPGRQPCALRLSRRYSSPARWRGRFPPPI